MYYLLILVLLFLAELFYFRIADRCNYGAQNETYIED